MRQLSPAAVAILIILCLVVGMGVSSALYAVSPSDKEERLAPIAITAACAMIVTAVIYLYLAWK